MVNKTLSFIAGLTLLGMGASYAQTQDSTNTNSENIEVTEIKYEVKKTKETVSPEQVYGNLEGVCKNYENYDKEDQKNIMILIPLTYEMKRKEWANKVYNIEQKYNQKAAELKAQYDAKTKTLDAKIKALQGDKLVEKNEKLKADLEISQQQFKEANKKLTECEKK